MTDLSGSLPALVTPFKNGAVDEDAYQRLVERQIAAGSSAVCPAGTTGESATLSHAEHRRVIELAVEAAAGRVPVVAGVGSNSTAEALGLAKFAEEAGADAMLCVCGYYNKPPQAGLIKHFTALHDASRLPIVLYNVPGRTVVSLSVETIGVLSKLPRIIGIKDATGDLARVALQRLASGPDFIQLSGEDMTAVGFNAMGGRGCIGVTANIAPALCAKMQKASLAGDFDAALAIQDRLAPLHDVLFIETNPGPVKYAMSALGLCSAEVRSPLCEPGETTRRRVEAVLEGLEGVL
ncbi:MAG: 4-hydroxy-tetrahydrodipicolinate synthase [Alphaproteobacteria bacterium]|nr:4-hydroxy-tetrahydrodipicolinate synthase [Alphaproteobacteria bacterium]